MIKIVRIVPGELEEGIEPEAFGFDIVHVESPIGDEATDRIGKLYAEAKRRTGVVIPQLEQYLVRKARGRAPGSVASRDDERVEN